MKKIALMGSEDFIEPFKREGFEVLWVYPLAYSMLYEKGNKVFLNEGGFKEKLDFLKSEIFKFNPDYFLANQWFFIKQLLNLADAKAGAIAGLYIDFLSELHKKGIVTIITCEDDTAAFGVKPIRSVTTNFNIVATYTLQNKKKYERCGQAVIYFPYYVTIDLPTKHVSELPSDFFIPKLDVFFIGTMGFDRRMFLKRLSRKISDLNYFFGSKTIFYTSLKETSFDWDDRNLVKEFYKKTSVNVIYGLGGDKFFNKCWGVSNRVFNVAYCRSFFIIDYRKHLEDIFDIDLKLYCFRNLNECCKLIRFYLKNPSFRDELSDKFYNIVKERFTITPSIKQLIYNIEAATMKNSWRSVGN